jgi:hypothetical protein
MTSDSVFRWLVLGALVAARSALGFGETIAANQALDRYLHSPSAACSLEEQNMEIQIQASLPKLKKQGSMDGLKVISATGQVAYRFLRFTGDKLIKTDVIARFLTAETHPQADLGDIRIGAKNYKFHFQRMEEYQGSAAYVFQLKPKKKRAGLFKGELWLDAESATPVREAGELVKSPSFFIQHFRFVRDYPEHASCQPPRRTEIMVQTRIAGDAEMVVWQRPVDGDWQPADAVSGLQPTDNGSR